MEVLPQEAKSIFADAAHCKRANAHAIIMDSKNNCLQEEKVWINYPYLESEGFCYAKSL